MSPTSRPIPRLLLGGLAAVSAASLVVTACSADDDGENVRGASGSGSGSGSGLSEEELEGSSDDPLINQAVEDHQAYLVDQTEALVDDVGVFTDALRSGDVAAATAPSSPGGASWPGARQVPSR